MEEQMTAWRITGNEELNQQKRGNRSMMIEASGGQRNEPVTREEGVTMTTLCLHDS